jgi:hypothetical protein
MAACAAPSIPFDFDRRPGLPEKAFSELRSFSAFQSPCEGWISINGSKKNTF